LLCRLSGGGLSGCGLGAARTLARRLFPCALGRRFLPARGGQGLCLSAFGLFRLLRLACFLCHDTSPKWGPVLSHHSSRHTRTAGSDVFCASAAAVFRSLLRRSNSLSFAG